MILRTDSVGDDERTKAAAWPSWAIAPPPGAYKGYSMFVLVYKRGELRHSGLTPACGSAHARNFEHVVKSRGRNATLLPTGTFKSYLRKKGKKNTGIK